MASPSSLLQSDGGTLRSNEPSGPTISKCSLCARAQETLRADVLCEAIREYDANGNAATPSLPQTKPIVMGNSVDFL
jgi:hypothetical protein